MRKRGKAKSKGAKRPVRARKNILEYEGFRARIDLAKPQPADYHLFGCRVNHPFDELIAQQRRTLLKTAQRIVPHITEEDLLQPNDFPALELHPHFRHEEGILDGLLMACAFLSSQNSKHSSIRNFDGQEPNSQAIL